MSSPGALSRMGPNRLLKFDSCVQIAAFFGVLKPLGVLKKSNVERFERQPFFGALSQREFRQPANPSIERTSQGLRPCAATHVER
jgi:hypothetical protein